MLIMHSTKCWVSTFKSVLDHFNPGGLIVFIQVHCHHIKTGWHFKQLVAHQIIQRCSAQAGLLAAIHSLKWRAVLCALMVIALPLMPRFYLNKNQNLLIPSHNVNFTKGFAIVAGDDGIPKPAQMKQGKGFTKGASISAYHSFGYHPSSAKNSRTP